MLTEATLAIVAGSGSIASLFISNRLFNQNNAAGISEYAEKQNYRYVGISLLLMRDSMCVHALVFQYLDDRFK